tara:strand:- start:6967 stop:7368 length:402 start_codon:yes stop_codon:yes gene_type:complete
MKLTKLYNDILKESLSLDIMKNMEKSDYFGSEFGQDVEAAGTYVSHKDVAGEINDPNYLTGVANLKSPLYIDVDDDTLIKYKYHLADKYKAKGKGLTKKLMSLGYDSIVTRLKNRNGEFGEIILFPNAKFMLS